MEVTPLEEIRKQCEPEIISIPGFRPGATINVAVKPVDVTPRLLAAGIGNPLLGGRVDPSKIDYDRMAAVLDAVAKEALVQPTYDEIASIAPLTLAQKVAIFNHAMQGVNELASFRNVGGIEAAGPTGEVVGS